MPPESPSPDDPEEWLNRARSNLIQASGHGPGVYLEDLCFQAQQAAEKAFKALLLHHGSRLLRIHDLAQLITLLEDYGESVPERVREASRLRGCYELTHQLLRNGKSGEQEDTDPSLEPAFLWDLCLGS